MQPFSHVNPIDDFKNLNALTNGYGDLHGTYTAIEKAYNSYVATSGSPHLKAIALSTKQKNCLHKAYTNAAKKFGLDWIPLLRSELLGSCPMCGNSALGTVEHYLPKTPFPEFSVFSLNLVPSCSSCNQKRGSKHASGVAHQLLHPIFDADMLRKLRLITQFDTSELVLKFELAFNSKIFTVNEGARIWAHINMCIDHSAFKRATMVQISKTASRVKKKDVAEWESVIMEDLETMCDANLEYGWEASCLRGLLEVSMSQLSSVLVPKMLR
ncbi:hypothetical protein [Pseudomonas viridiflava]|uniref:hypothetical protein n=1 Tax=Pseudomonas syringae group TaxID=136849 RepID=UPI002E9A08A3|nr:hypothetical protein [Pseudomonas viridiflava]